MTIRVIRAAATIAAVALAMMAMGAAAQQTGPTLHKAPATGPETVPGEIVVAFRSGVAGSERAAARSAAHVRAERNLLLPGAQLVKVEGGQTVQEAIAALERRRDVRYAEPNWIYHADSTTPDDPLFGSLWGLHNSGQAVNGHPAGTADVDIDAPEAWDRSRGSAATVVAVVDTGVAWDHPDLAPNLWSNGDEVAGNGVDDDGNGKVDDVRGWDFVDGDNNPWDYNDHGTHVAGTIAARGDNGVGVAGVAWQASIMPLRALNASGLGTAATITDSFTYAAANGAAVVNASIVGTGNSQAMSDAITNNPDTLFVVPAGNAGQNNDTTPRYPCNDPAANLICVAATDNRDALASFSNYGATSVDLAAPGVDIQSTRPHYTDAFSDGFESGLGAWTVESGPWGTETALNTTWLTDSPAANYAPRADWAIRTSAKVDIGTRTDCALRFRYRTFLEQNFDWLYVQSSTDATTWQDVARIGTTGGVVNSAFYALGAAGSRYYRFRLTSDASINWLGVFIDDVRISCPGGTYGSDDYRFNSGTSMAAPHVSGAAAVLFDTPRATVAKVKAALLDSGDPIAALSGKTVSGRRLNLDAALASPILKANTTTTITSHDPNPSLVGQPVTVNYTVTVDAPDTGTPTGDVTVTDGVDSCTGTVADGKCTITLTATEARSLTATYAGDSNFNASASAAQEHNVNRIATVTAITSDDPDPSVVGQPVTVRYSVTADAAGSGTPTGDVTVTDGSRSCTGTVAAGECTITLTTAGSRSLTATYAGDDTYEASPASAIIAHQVNRADTTTTVTSDAPDPSEVGQAIEVRFAVAPVAPGSGTPTGSVIVSDGVDSCKAHAWAGNCTLRLTTVGTRKLTATFGGDSSFNASASAEEAHTVNRLATVTAITAHDPAPSVVGQPVTVRYSVTADAAGSGTPTGNVTVTDGSRSCTGTVAAGECTITFDAAGLRSLTATYAGDDLYESSPASAVISHQVNRADTTTAITSDTPDPSAVGQAVTIEFAVGPVAPGAGTPTGNVTVTDGVDSCTAMVTAGSCDIRLTTAGARTLTATYAGDSGFSGSASADEAHTVTAPSGPGDQPAVSAPLAHVSGAGQTNPRFRVAAKPRLAQSSRRAPIGTTFTYTLDIAATVRLNFTQPRRGRTVKHKCVPAGKRNRRKPTCALPRGSLTFAGHAGPNTVRFTGWLSRTKKLKPGRYTLTITAITPHVGTTSQQLRFRILPSASPSRARPERASASREVGTR